MKSKLNLLAVCMIISFLSCNKSNLEQVEVAPNASNVKAPASLAVPTTTWNIEAKYSSIPNYFGKIKQAIADAKVWFNSHQNEQLIFSFPAGNNNIENPLAAFAAITIDNLNPGLNGRLVFEGNAPQGPDPTIFTFPGVDQNEVVANNSNNITFRGIQFTRGQKTVTQGYVTAKGVEAGQGFVTIKIDPGFPTIPDVFSDLANGKWLKKYNESVGSAFPVLVPCNNQQVGWDTYTTVSTRTYKLKLIGTSAPSYYSVGDLLAVKCKRFAPAYQYTDCSGITYENVVWNGQARGLISGSFDDIYFNNCRVVRLPDNLNISNTREKKYCISTPSGGPQIGNEHTEVRNDGKNIIIENCRFEALGDDEIALFKVGNAIIRNNTLSASFVRSINLNQSNATYSGNIIDWCGYDHDNDGCTNDGGCIIIQ